MIPAEARGAWREIETRLRPYVARRVGSTSEVDDIVQDILVKTLGGLGTLRDGERFGGWVYRIAEHASLVPTVEQRRAIPDEINLVAAEGVSIVCGKSKLKLARDGSLRVRGREVAVRGSRSTRIQGGVVRVN